MKTHSAPVQTWPWGDILRSTGYTDAALRRNLQRGLVSLDASANEFRSRASLWDIAKLRVHRHICDLGVEAGPAFGHASLAVETAYDRLFAGKALFGTREGAQQQLVQLVLRRPGFGIRYIRIRPDVSKTELKDLALAAADPNNIIVPLHWLVRDAWYALSDLPTEVGEWLKATSENMKKLGLDVK